MKSTVDAIRSTALALSRRERASLAHDLIRNLDPPDAFEARSEIDNEIGRRVRMVRAGTATGRLTEQVFGEIEAKTRR